MTKTQIAHYLIGKKIYKTETQTEHDLIGEKYKKGEFHVMILLVKNIQRWVPQDDLIAEKYAKSEIHKILLVKNIQR